MQISIIDVGSLSTHAARNGRSYQSVEVTYKNEQGQAQSKKLMSFSNPAVFKAAQTWEKGDTVNIATEKDANGYWQWTAILAEGESAPAPTNQSAVTSSPKAATATRVTGSNYETKEERAERQIMIVRQSSLANAVATLATHGSAISAEQVIALAKTYEGFVMNQGSAQTEPPSFDNIEDDIPL